MGWLLAIGAAMFFIAPRYWFGIAVVLFLLAEYQGVIV